MDYTNIIKYAIGLVFSILTYIFVKREVSAQQFNEAMKWVRIAVQAAEMLFKDPGSGSKKKSWVTEFLEEHGIVYDEAQVEAMIEAAVLDLRNGYLLEEE